MFKTAVERSEKGVLLSPARASLYHEPCRRSTGKGVDRLPA